MKFISHLDLMRFFDRALRRCDLPIAYSIGFNPHPQMIFGLPLTVGVTSECEYADFEFSVPVSLDDFVERLSKQLPDGIRIVDAKIKYSKQNIMAIIDFASYNIIIGIEGMNSVKLLREKLDEFLKQKEIIVEKENKKGKKLVDIRPMIHEVKADLNEDTQGNVFNIYAYLSAGNTFNLRPELMIKALSENLGMDIKIKGVHRNGLFAMKNGEAKTPMDEELLREN